MQVYACTVYLATLPNILCMHIHNTVKLLILSIIGASLSEPHTARLQRRCQRDQKRRSQQTKVRQARLDRQRVRKAAEHPAARQTRLATDRQRTDERREAEQSEARQARLERLSRKTA